MTPYELEGETGLLTVIQDITDRKKAEDERIVLEAQLRQSQKLESIGTLASGVAHEVNNPLMGIINYADLIKSRVKDDSLKEFSAGIVEEGDRLAKIVRNLLSFARQDVDEELTPISMEDIVESSLLLTGAILRKDQITLEKDIQKDLPEVNCRSQQIQQVIVNLLTNARDALNQRFKGYDEDKILKITARPLDKNGEKWIRLTVEDHGVGMSPEVRDRVFDPFFTTKSRAEGTGLGLSVSYGIIKEHRGELSVESEPGTGSKFHVDIPAIENR
jgi:signal transduction histidine kinase